MPSDLDAPERTMTRRELRILRARAEAAGQPAPDVVFLPNGETTITGAIDILDSPESPESPRDREHAPELEATTDSAIEAELVPDSDAAGVITEQPSVLAEQQPEAAELDQIGSEVIEDAVVVTDVDRAADSGSSDTGEAPEVDAAGVITEQPVDGDAGEEPDERSGASEGQPADPSEPVQIIPALIEPIPGESPRFQTDAGSAPAEIVVDAEPARDDAENPTPDASPGAPAPGTLRPFDALFLPPSAGERTESPVIDTSSVQPANDSDGLRGDILAALVAPVKPYGHWSTQNDDGPDAEANLTRDVGMTTGALTTHALVLPSIPDSGEPLLSPLTSTGEVMVTGTIDLPRSFGSTGAHPALFDHSEVDALIDDSDREDADSGIAPVRASRAVSSTTTTRAMIGAETEKKSRVLPIVAIAVLAAALVAVATVAVMSLVFNQF